MKALKKIIAVIVLSVISVLFACIACYYLLLCNLLGIPALFAYIATALKAINVISGEEVSG